MIVESAVLATWGIATYRYLNQKRIELKKLEKEFKETWNLTMKYEGTKNKNDQTFEILEWFPKKHYGCDCIISIPWGLDYSDLIKLIPTIENAFQGTVICNKEKNSAYMRFAADLSKASVKDKIRFKWYKIMMSDNKLRNQNQDTFNIIDIKDDKKYGFDITVSIPEGLSYTALEPFQDVLESNFKARVNQKWIQSENKVQLKFIMDEIPDDLKFEPNKTKVDELYFGGMTYDYQKVTADLSVNSHVIFTGMNNTGKNVCLNAALTNHIYYHTEKEFELYLANISAKKDLRIFRNVKQCLYYADDLNKLYLLLKHLQKMMLNRNNAFNSIKEEDIVNIYEWNKKFPHKKMKQIIFAMDEISYIMSDSLDNDKDSELKNKCRDILMALFKEGRSIGLHIACCLQRPDKESFPPRFKSQIGIKVCFYQPNDASSLVVLDSNEATKLKHQREAVVDMGEKYLMKTLYLDNAMVRQLISKSVEENHEFIDIQGTKTQDNKNEKKESKTESLPPSKKSVSSIPLPKTKNKKDSDKK